MSPRDLRFERLAVHRAGARVRRGDGFVLDELSPGVSVVFGPNGSGKSTTALAMQATLWPGMVADLAPATLDARLRDDESVWQVEIDAGHVAVVRDGRPATLDVGPAEHRRRYRLALDDLLVEDDASFAAAVAHASQGGYDVGGAATALGFARRPSSPRKLASELRAREDRVEEARARQRAVQERADRLAALRLEQDQARIAVAEAARLEQARKAVEAGAEVRDLERQLDALDPGVARLRGDERERLDALAERARDAEARRERERGRLRAAEEALTETDLPEGGADANAVRRLRAAVDRLASVDAELRRAHDELRTAQEMETRARARLAPHLDEARLHALDTVHDVRLDEFAHRADRLRARRAELDARRRSLESAEPPDPDARAHDRDTLLQGVAELSRWLAAPDREPAPSAPRRTTGVAIAAAVLALAFAVVLTVVHHLAWLAGVAVALALAVTVALRSRWPAPDATPSTAAMRRSDYSALGLPEPEAWRPAPVAELLAGLTRLAREREAWDARERALAEVRREQDDLAADEDALERERTEIEDRLGVRIEIGDAWLPLFVDTLRDWQRARDAAAAAQASASTLDAERAALLTSVQDDLAPFGYPPSGDVGTAAEALRDLAERRERHDAAVRERGATRSQLTETIEPELVRLGEERRAILDRLELSEEREDRVDAWLAQRTAYQELTRRLNTSRSVRDDRRDALGDRPELLELPVEELDRRLAEQTVLAGRHQGLLEEVAEIEAEINEAKRGHELSEALAARDEARARLSDARDDARAAAIGAVLAERTRREATEATRPAVFRRANELLARFSLGTLELELDDRSEPPTFRARSGGRPSRPVHELSVGERIQTLTAVRVAFLEQDERYRLPLLLDETLGTTDDQRAGVVIDAVAELAREGRQVVYFTAQHDEVAKWAARLEGGEVPFRTVDLAAARSGARADRRPLPPPAASAPEPPAPDGRDHDAYGRALNVPDLDPAFDEVDDAHVWHVLSDPADVHAMLRQGVRSWGQLRTLVGHGGLDLLPGGERAWEAAEAEARALDALLRARRVGLGVPVDRAALEDSGHVSDAFIDPVAELAADLEGDAEALLEALDAGRVPRWRTRNTEALRTYFEDHGHLPDREALTPDAIRARVLAAVASDLNAGRTTQERIERLLATSRQERDA